MLIRIYSEIHSYQNFHECHTLLHSSNMDRLSKSEENSDLKSCQKLHLNGKGSSKEEEKRGGESTHPRSDFSLARLLTTRPGWLAAPWAEEWVETTPWAEANRQLEPSFSSFQATPYFPSLPSLPTLPTSLIHQTGFVMGSGHFSLMV